MRLPFPVYVPTYKRYQSNLTIKMLTRIGCPYKAVVCPEEEELYVESGVPRENILVMPFPENGLTQKRNWIWNHAQASGTPYFWTFDDNITQLYRMNRNLQIRCETYAPLLAMEDFVQRYDNIAISGMEYRWFRPSRDKQPPFIWNAKVFSNMLIKTDIPFRNECFYEDDIDLAIRLLKAGRCTCVFYAFLIEKMQTMTVGGGMTPHYIGDGRKKMAEELAAKHPDCCKVGWRFGRPQHVVNLSRWKRNNPQLKNNIVIPQGVNEYGMKLVPWEGK